MTIECVVIVGIILIMSFIFWRRRHIQWLWATLPLMLVPLSYVVVNFLLGELFKITVSGVSGVAGVIVMIAAVGISCVWLGLVSNGFKNKKTRVSYITVANTFNVALAAILSSNILISV